MADIIEVKRRFFHGLDADKPAAGSNGDRYYATDKNKLYYWTAGGWKTGLGYEFVNRPVNTQDFTEANFTRDGAAHVNGLDVSGIVPAEAVAVLFEMYMRATAVSINGSVYRNATSTFNRCFLTSQVANVWCNPSQAIIMIDADRLLDYLFPNTVNDIRATVIGWFI